MARRGQLLDRAATFFGTVEQEHANLQAIEDRLVALEAADPASQGLNAVIKQHEELRAPLDESASRAHNAQAEATAIGEDLRLVQEELLAAHALSSSSSSSANEREQMQREAGAAVDTVHQALDAVLGRRADADRRWKLLRLKLKLLYHLRDAHSVCFGFNA